MSVKYFDICDTAFKRDEETWELFILRSTPDGKVFEDKPTKYELSMFGRNWVDSSVIDKETAYKLAVNPALSY
ncbi:MAG: hypothetical protein IJ831_00625 [Spirochaetales bacterium]|nr:hypothetical protein [Spirochaetales bacterium]